jgi:hypothetical protein
MNRPGTLRKIAAVVFVAFALASAGCGDAITAGDSERPWWDGDNGGWPGEEPDEQERPPSEPEPAFVFSAPAASARFVWIANETRGTVARVGFDTGALRISTSRVGARPGALVASRNEDMALVLNEGSDSVSIVRVSEAGEDTVEFVEGIPGANRLVMDESGEFAAIWFDAREQESGDPFGPLAEVGLLRLDRTPAELHVLSVGVGIQDARFRDAGGELLVFTDEGVSRVDAPTVTSDRFIPPVRVAAEGEELLFGDDREFVVSSSGASVMVRNPDDPVLRVVDLRTEAIAELVFDAPLTDVDAIPGAGQAVALDGSDTVWLFDTAAFELGERVERTGIALDGLGARFATVSPDGEVMAISGGVGELWLALVSLDGDVRVFNLRKGVRTVSFSPDSRSVVVIHNKLPGEPVAGEPEADLLAKSWAYSVVDVESGATKLVRTEAEPTQAVADDATRSLFLRVVSEPRGIHHVEWFDLESFDSRRIEFNGVPDAIGLIPGVHTLYVSQTHDLGRIALLDIITGELREITGYELNALIE